MTFSELCAEVYALTRRSDLVAETESAVRSATLACHQQDYFWKDIQEVGIYFDSASYVQSFKYRALIPRFRAVKYLRKYDLASSTPGTSLELITPEAIFDRYALTKQDVFYLAGAYLQINSSTEHQHYLLGCYINPSIAPNAYSSWIALDHPFAIVYGAAATVFKMIGKDEEAAANRLLLAEQKMAITTSNVVAEGF